MEDEICMLSFKGRLRESMGMSYFTQSLKQSIAVLSEFQTFHLETVEMKITFMILFSRI